MKNKKKKEKRINKNKISFIFSFLWLIAETLQEHVTLFLNVDLKFYLIAIIFINFIIALHKKFKLKRFINENKQKNKGKGFYEDNY